MSKYIVIALHDAEDVQAVASELSEMLAHGGIVREVLVPDDPVFINTLKDAVQPSFEDEGDD